MGDPHGCVSRKEGAEIKGGKMRRGREGVAKAPLVRIDEAIEA